MGAWTRTITLLMVRSGLAWNIFEGCYGLNVYLLQNSCWNLFANVLVLEGWAFKKRLGHKDSTHMGGFNDFTKEIWRVGFPSQPFCFYYVMTHQEGHHQLLEPWHWTSHSPKLSASKFLFIVNTQSQAFCHSNTKCTKTKVEYRLLSSQNIGSERK
jgi:hypothetical protein